MKPNGNFFGSCAIDVVVVLLVHSLVGFILACSRVCVGVRLLCLQSVFDCLFVCLFLMLFVLFSDCTCFCCICGCGRVRVVMFCVGGWLRWVLWWFVLS